MNLRLYIICIICVLALAGNSEAIEENTATVHGLTYKWDTIEILDSTIVDINSTPPQSMVAKNGEFSFELVPGDYNITARYYENGVLTYSTEETFKIESGGSYVYDLLLPQVSPEKTANSSEVNGTSANLGKSGENSSSNKTNPITGEFRDKQSDRNNSNGLSILEQIRVNPPTASYLLIFFALILLVAGGYGLFRSQKKIEKNTSQQGKKGNISRDLFNLVNISELSVKIPGRSIDPKIKEAKANIEESAHVKEQESKASESVQVSESSILKRKVPAESREYPAQETSLAKSRLEDSEKTCFEEPADNSEVEDSTIKKKLPLSSDLQEVMDIVRGHGGRITQKDLRNRLKYSEVKVSLLLSELEKRDLIEKFKRGRENIVILKDKER